MKKILCLGLISASLFLLAACNKLTENPMQNNAQTASQWQQLSGQYKTLSALRGHFDDQEWNDVIDSAQGEKYKLMESIAQVLNKQSFSRSQVLQDLGKPNAQWLATQKPLRLMHPELSPDADEYLWYSWRGKRDGLLLIIKEQKVSRAVWSLAYE